MSSRIVTGQACLAGSTISPLDECRLNRCPGLAPTLFRTRHLAASNEASKIPQGDDGLPSAMCSPKPTCQMGALIRLLQNSAFDMAVTPTRPTDGRGQGCRTSGQQPTPILLWGSRVPFFGGTLMCPHRQPYPLGHLCFAWFQMRRLPEENPARPVEFRFGSQMDAPLSRDAAILINDENLAERSTCLRVM